MLRTILFVLLTPSLLGVVTSDIFAGIIHILLLVVLSILVVKLIQDQRRID